MIESSSEGRAEVSVILDEPSWLSLLVCQTIWEVDRLMTGPLGSMFSWMEKATACSRPPCNRVVKSSLWPENVMQSC